MSKTPLDDELQIAAQQGDLELVKSLIEQGFEINAFDELGMTALHYAAKNEHYEVAAYLIEHGAEVNAHHEPTIGNTPLGAIAGNCSLAMAQILVDAGADPTIRGWMQLNALDRAMERKRGDGPAVYSLLLLAKKNPRRRKPT